MKSILTGFLLLGFSVWSQNTSKELTYNEFLGYVKKYHPLVKSANLEINQAQANLMMARGGFDHLLVPSGTLHYQLFDDRDYPYAVNPQFKAWLPLTRMPNSWLIFTPGQPRATERSAPATSSSVESCSQPPSVS